MANLLIVEAEFNSTGLLAGILEELGHRVIARIPQDHAGEVVGKWQPDLVVVESVQHSQRDTQQIVSTLKGLCIPLMYVSPINAHSLKPTSGNGTLKSEELTHSADSSSALELQSQIATVLNQHSHEHQLAALSAPPALISSQSALITTDINGLITHINSVAVELIGGSLDKAIGTAITDILWLEDAEGKELRPCQQALSGQTFQHQTVWMYRLQKAARGSLDPGLKLPISLSAAPMMTAAGAVIGSVLTFCTTNQTSQSQLSLEPLAAQLELPQLILTIRQSLNLDAVLTTTTREVGRLLKAERTLIYQFEVGEKLRVVAETVALSTPSLWGQAVANRSHPQNYREPFLDGSLRCYSSLFRENLEDAWGQLLKRQQVCSALLVPILSSPQHLWGVLSLQQCSGPRLWQPKEMALMEQLAHQVGIAIQQSQQYEQAQRQVRQAQLLNEIVREIRTSLDLEHILQRTADWVREAFGASRCLIRLGTPGAATFAYMVQSSYHVPLPDGCMPIADNPLVQRVFEQSAPICIEDTSLAPAWLQPLRPYLQRSRVSALMVTTIRMKGNIQGLICVHQCDRTRPWRQDESLLLQQAADQLAIAAHQAALYQNLQQANLELARLAHLDGLTQLANRRFFDDFLEQEYRRQRRNGRPLSLLLCDVDHFKAFNDTYGHIAGDDCLRVLSKELERQVKRPGDLLARYGGEEFAIVLPDTDQAGAITVAERILTAIRNLEITPAFAPQRSKVTVSLGISSIKTICAEETPAQLVAAADMALYRAKAAGRDCYRI